MNSPRDRSALLYQRSQELRNYVGLDEAQHTFAKSAWPIIEPDLDSFVEDFYAEILQHEPARRVFSGPEQVLRLKGSLRHWIMDLFTAEHDQAFVARRWAVGLRHVQIGLEPVWVSAAMSRLRDQILKSLRSRASDWEVDLLAIASAISRLMDLDLAIIQDAYHAESVAKQLAEERDFAEGVIDTAQAVVMMVTIDGVIVRGNQFLANQLGWDKIQEDNVRRINCFDLVVERQRDDMRRFIREAAEGRTPDPLETLLIVSSGPPPRVRWHARRYDERKVDGPVATAPLVLCVGQDITELSDAQQRLVRSERLAAIGQTMTGLAHESRNAFQRSQAALETLSLELEDRPTAAKLVERIQRAHDHLLHLYEEVLQFARPIRLDLQDISLAAVIHQTWDHVRQVSSEKPIRLNLSMGSSVEVQADPFALEQVFRNLLENAIEASHRDGTIDVLCRDTWVGVDRCVEIEVRDHGVGLSTDALGRVFEPFYTTRSRGTGLGLPISRRLIESHGGTLDLRQADPGVRAIIRLPLKARPVEYADANLATDYRRTGVAKSESQPSQLPSTR